MFCKNCGKPVSKYEQNCINCGEQNSSYNPNQSIFEPKKSIKNTIFESIMVVLVLVFIAGITINIWDFENMKFKSFVKASDEEGKSNVVEHEKNVDEITYNPSKETTATTEQNIVNNTPQKNINEDVEIKVAESVVDVTTGVEVTNTNRPYLGIKGGTVSQEMQVVHNLPAGFGVSEVNQGTNAARSGLIAGDIITKYNGQTIMSFEELTAALVGSKIGDKVTLEVYRQGEYVNFDVELQDNVTEDNNKTTQQSTKPVQAIDKDYYTEKQNAPITIEILNYSIEGKILKGKFKYSRELTENEKANFVHISTMLMDSDNNLLDICESISDSDGNFYVEIFAQGPPTMYTYTLCQIINGEEVKAEIKFEFSGL